MSYGRGSAAKRCCVRTSSAGILTVMPANHHDLTRYWRFVRMSGAKMSRLEARSRGSRKTGLYGRTGFQSGYGLRMFLLCENRFAMELPNSVNAKGKSSIRYLRASLLGSINNR